MRFLLKKSIKVLIGLALTFTGWTTLAQVTDISLSIPRDSTAFPGDTVRLPVILNTNLDSENILAFRLDMSYNGPMKPIGISKAGSLASGWDVLFNNVADGRFVVTGAGTTALSGTGTLYYVDFEIQHTTHQTSPSVYLNTSGASYFNEGGYNIAVDYGQIT
ncbi:MAG TPA: cohesin domain-containing protein, partial [Chryseosolibacter sp.]|nr:cohesin domain-containing protein [Chryseosolibacter sp.]